MFFLRSQRSNAHVEAMDGAVFAERFSRAVKNFTYCGLWADPERTYVCATLENYLAGFARLEETRNDLYIGYLEVARAHRGSGVSRVLLRGVFERAAQEKKAVVMSPYTEMGLQRLDRQISRLKKAYPDIILYYE